jgi:hypothetical protein
MRNARKTLTLDFQWQRKKSHSPQAKKHFGQKLCQAFWGKPNPDPSIFARVVGDTLRSSQKSAVVCFSLQRKAVTPSNSFSPSPDLCPEEPEKVIKQANSTYHVIPDVCCLL